MPTVALSLAACDDEPMPPAVSQDIVDIVIETADVSTLETAVIEADLVSALQSDGPFTVFAPVNSAFDGLGSDLVGALLEPENADLLTSILTYHVVPGVAAASTDLTNGQMVPTLQGDDLTIGISGSTVTVGAATVTGADVEATNGIIHLIDQVLIPEVDIVDTGILNEFYTLVDLVRSAGLESTLRGDNSGAGYTVFAPTEEAFAALSSVPTGQDLVDILTYHVVGATVESGALSDGQVVTTVDGSRTFTVNIDSGSGAVSITDGSGATVNVVATDVTATNGIVHVIDGVLLPS
ncbi:MAG: fasciclin domain-containing protein [Gemmatimonadota bacterium]